MKNESSYASSSFAWRGAGKCIMRKCLHTAAHAHKSRRNDGEMFIIRRGFLLLPSSHFGLASLIFMLLLLKLIVEMKINPQMNNLHAVQGKIFSSLISALPHSPLVVDLCLFVCIKMSYDSEFALEIYSLLLVFFSHLSALILFGLKVCVAKQKSEIGGKKFMTQLWSLSHKAGAHTVADEAWNAGKTAS